MTAHENAAEEAFAASRDLFFEGIAHFENGRLERALVCFEECQRLTPGRASVLGNLGVTLFHLNRLEEAIPALRQATGADASLAQAWACLGLAHGAKQQWRVQADALEKRSHCRRGRYRSG